MKRAPKAKEERRLVGCRDGPDVVGGRATNTETSRIEIRFDDGLAFDRSVAQSGPRDRYM